MQFLGGSLSFPVLLFSSHMYFCLEFILYIPLILFDTESVGAVNEAFVKLHDKGLIYQGVILYIFVSAVLAVLIRSLVIWA